MSKEAAMDALIGFDVDNVRSMTTQDAFNEGLDAGIVAMSEAVATLIQEFQPDGTTTWREQLTARLRLLADSLRRPDRSQ
jgi:hypothetical protein